MGRIFVEDIGLRGWAKILAPVAVVFVAVILTTYALRDTRFWPAAPLLFLVPLNAFRIVGRLRRHLAGR